MVFNVRYAIAVLISLACASTARADALTSDPFAKGSRAWSVTAGASCDPSIAWVYSTQIGVSYYVADSLALEYGAIAGYVNAKRTEGGVLGGPELGLRWHVAKSRRWSTYLEGRVGMVLQQSPITADTLRFNFNLQPGAGVTYRLNNEVMVQSGFRWHHLSNGRIRGKEHNFGYDGPMLYLGLRRSF